MIMIVLGSVSSIFVFRAILISWNAELGGIVSGIINAFQIQLMNFIYTKVALKLNDWENHKTQTQYEDSLIAKSFLFKFINSYNSLFYIAFFKRFDVAVESCPTDDPTCLNELQIQLASIFVTQLVVNNAIELATPYFTARQRRIADAGQSGLDIHNRARDVDKTSAEKEYALGAYSSTFEDFDEIVIQFGYTTLFVVAFPLNPLLSLIANFIETRLDSYKLLHLERRPHPRGADNIGTWYAILEIIGILSVITNIALVMFVSETGDNITDGHLSLKFLIFLILEHGVILLKVLVGVVIPDEPILITEHLNRQNHITDIILKGNKEEPDSALKQTETAEEKAAAKELENFPIGTSVKEVRLYEKSPQSKLNLTAGRFSARTHWIKI